eukprot:scaffold62347_cov60-Phaeocystis_antarctica.AAC.7
MQPIARLAHRGRHPPRLDALRRVDHPLGQVAAYVARRFHPALLGQPRGIAAGLALLDLVRVRVRVRVRRRRRLRLRLRLRLKVRPCPA